LKLLRLLFQPFDSFLFGGISGSGDQNNFAMLGIARFPGSF
jgi:hypothetical protein